MRVLIAPQEFKGTLSADEAAAAIGRGVRLARPEWERDVLPMSDGGPGLLDAVRHAVRAESFAVVVRDPLGERVLGRYIQLHGSGEVVVEAAQANGLWHLLPDRLDAMRASTEGVGDLLIDAAALRPAQIAVGVGGSATTDGGSGMARALGAELLDERGVPIPPGGGGLARLAAIQWERPAIFDGIELLVATDVTNRLLGPNGAAAVYGPQKGASPEQVRQLEDGLARFADVVQRDLGIDVRGLAGGGAAGGLAAGLVAFLGAGIVSGFEVVAEVTRFEERLAKADVVVTGEGRFDSQSLQGKVTGRVIELARGAGKPVVVFAGRVSIHDSRSAIHDPSPEGRFTIFDSVDVRVLGEERGMKDAAGVLAEVAGEWAGSIHDSRFTISD